jgi:hypothetical protein
MSDLKIASKSLQEELRLEAKDRFVTEVLASTAIVDLLNLDIGENGIVEQPSKYVSW